MRAAPRPALDSSPASTRIDDPPTVAVVVLNWNGLEDTRACVRSLLAQTWPAVEVLVVDNASANHEADALEQEFGARVRLIRNSENRGFTGGNEPGMQAALDEGRAGFVALLNNDAVAAPDWIEQMMRAAEAAPDVGLFASLMVFASDPGRVENAGTWILTTGEAVPRGRGQPIAEFSEPVDLLGACGGAVVYRADVLREVGLFRDDFFANFEDVDLSLRIVAVAGHRCAFVPRAVVRHKLNASIEKVRDDAFRVRSIRNLTLAYWFNMPLGVIVLNAPWLFVTWFVVPLLAPLLGQWDLTRILVRGRLRALAQWRSVLRERRRLRALRRGSTWRTWWLQRSFLTTYLRFVIDVVVRRRRRYME